MNALRRVEKDDERITWQLAHETLSRLARERAAADAEEGRWLLAAQRAAAHVHMGFGAFSEYVERLFGYKPRSTQEKLRVAEALESLPALARALEQGELSWSALRELTRVVVSDTEHEWLEFARGKTLRQLELVLAGKQPGDAPGSAPDPKAQRHVLRFEVAGETFALFRDALRELRRRAGATLDDDSALLEMARCVLGGPRDKGRASYQVVLNLCPECDSARQHAEGGLVPVGPELAEMADCDAQHVALNDESSQLPQNDIEPHLTARVGALEATAEWPGRSPIPAAVEGDTASGDRAAIDGQAAHVGDSRSSAFSGNRREPASIRTGSDAKLTNMPPTKSSPRITRPHPRATQTIPPALRRAVLLRDQRRCQVPGCQNASWLDLHHLELRSEGGRHSLDNLICICTSHHRAAHRGEILLDRDATGALRVRHGDGSAYGDPVRPHELDAKNKVFSALRHLGFGEGQVRAALERLRDTTAERSSFDGLLRAALSQLCPPHVGRS